MMGTVKDISIDVELNVNISVLPYTGCYISRIAAYDDRQDFVSIYELNDLTLADQRLIKIRMSSDKYNNIGTSGIMLDIKDIGQRMLIGDKCNYIPYQLIEDCKDGDIIDYIMVLPYHIYILLHITCKQDLTDEYEFNSNETAELFTKFDTAVKKCKNHRLIV